MIDKITKKDMIHPDVFDSENDPEKLRVESVINSITSHLTDTDEIDYHFSECDGHDEEHYEKLMSDLPKDAKWFTIYDSCYFPVFDGGSYSIIRVAHVPNNEFLLLSFVYGWFFG